jgi:hypothetical protein
MSTNLKTAGARFWTWIVCAFSLGAVVGFAAGIATIFALEALIS